MMEREPSSVPDKHILIRFRDQLGVRLAILYTALIIIAFSVTAWFSFYTAQQTLDEELAQKLTGIANLVSRSVDSDAIILLQPGDEGSPLHRIWTRRLQEIKDAMGLRDIFIFDHQNRVLLDVDQEVPIGREYRLLSMDAAEIQQIWAGRPAVSTLYEGSDGTFYKSGYVPLFNSQGKLVAGVGVEAGAGFLGLMRTLKEQIFLIAFMSILVTVTLSLVFSRSLLRPIRNLMDAMGRVSESGKLETVPVKGRDEIGYLGQKFNEMIESLSEKDQSLRKLYAAEKERAVIIHRLSAGLAHEIRNPLGAMTGYAELIERALAASTEADKTLDLLDGMKEEIRVLNRILTDFLSFAKEPRLQMEKVNLPSLLQRAVTAAISAGSIRSESLSENSLSVDYRMEDPHLEIHADPVELRRALLNILINSVQAMPKGGKLTVSCRHSEAAGMADLQISDTGTGIPEDDLDKIFHPFFTTKDEGTGLGLAISRKIIEGHGGAIDVISHPGTGTAFHVRLPILPPAGNSSLL